MPNLKPPLDEDAIRTLLPHHGDMCLIDSLSQWSPEQAVCQSSAHLRSSHPLSDDGHLGSATLIEVAAQAMALHGALLGSTDLTVANDTPVAPEKHGVLAGVRKVTLCAGNIALIAAPLTISVTLSSGDANTALYEFEVKTNGQAAQSEQSDQSHILASGRATVLFAATTRQ